MRVRFRRWSAIYLSLVLILILGETARAQNSRENGGDFSNNSHPLTKVPAGVILVKGAWSSSSDSTTPVPEGGSIKGTVYSNEYFGMTYPLPKGWTEKYEGPPPSESGHYVLAQINPADTPNGESRGNILITAQDMFFTSTAKNAMELAKYETNNLQEDYGLELPVTETKIGSRPFTFFAYWSPVAQLHWYVLATEIRCHAVQFVLTSRDTKVLQSLVSEMNKMQMAAEAAAGGSSPVCINDYANGKNLISRVDPVLAQHRFNSVPVRIIIDKNGTIKHIHFLSAFPDQVNAITEAFKRWKFRPYVIDHQAVEVETGIIFGRTSSPTARTSGAAVD